MPVNLDALTRVAIAGAKQAGVTATATITRPATVNPTTGASVGSPATQTVDVVQTDARRTSRRSDATWTQARVVLLCAASTLAWTPQVGDTVSFAGQTLRLVAIDTISSTVLLACGG